MIIEDWRGHLAWMFEESERTCKPLAFDCYAGLGGWDSGLDAEGFLVMGCEIDPKIAELNPYPMICANFTTLNPGDFKGFDLIVGSPPCRNYSQLIKVIGHTWKKHPPDPWGEGMRLVNAFLNFVIIAEPHYWLMENVPGLADYLWKPPRTMSYLGKTMRRAFWGNFPAFLVPRDYNKGTMIGHRDIKAKRGKPDPSIGDIFGKGNRKGYGGLKSWERAKIPLPVARALGVAVKQALLLV